MDLMTPEGGTIVWTAVIFVILAYLLLKFAWKPIFSMLEERETKIRESLQAAEKARAEAEESAARRLEVIQEAKKDAQRIISDARHSAEKLSQDMLTKAQKEAESLLDRAKGEIEAGRDRVLQEMRDLAVQLTMSATEKLIRKNLSKEDHRAAIEESLARMKDVN